MIKKFISDLSPIPSPDVDAPSPEAGELELELPDDNIASVNESMDLNTRLENMRSTLVYLLLAISYCSWF